MDGLPQWLDGKIVAWAQYLHWADLNFNRHLSGDENISTEIAIAFQWFASEFVVIEGWKELNHARSSISALLAENAKEVELLRRARNAVFHFQKAPLDNRLSEFATGYGATGWLVDLHQEFLRYLLKYPTLVYPYSGRRKEFVSTFFDVVGWIPEPLKK